MQSAAKVLSKTAELSVGYGSKIDFGHRDRLWISADWGLLHLWKDLELEHSISNTTAPIGEVSFSQTGDRILASPHIFNLANYQWEALPAIKAPLSDQLETSPPGSFTIRNSAWDAAGNQLVVYSTYRSPRQERRRDAGWSGPTKRLLLLEGKTRKLLKVLWQGDRIDDFEALIVSPDFVVAAGRSILLWHRHSDLSPAELKNEASANPYALTRSLRFSPDQTCLGQIRSDGYITLWQTGEWQLLARWQAHQNDGRAIAFHPHLPVLASGGWDDSLKLWSYQGELIESHALDNHIEGLTFNPQGNQLVVAKGGPSSALLIYQVDADAASVS